MGWIRTTWVAAVAALAATGAAAGEYRAPRTAYGVPDLGGLWTNAWLTKTERLKDFTTLSIPEAEAKAYDAKNRNRVGLPKDPVGQEDTEWPEAGDQLARIRGTARTSWITDPADGKIPYTAAAKAWNKAQGDAGETVFDNPEARPAGERCLATAQAGPPLRNGPDLNIYNIVQTREAVALVSEQNQSLRVIRLAGGHAPAAIRPWMGDSVGHWEGETLVVETVNFHRAQFRAPGGASSETRVVERFTRTGPAEIHYAFVVENPALYTQRWRGEMVLRPSAGPQFEFACHEGNYGFANILAGARAQEREAAAKGAATTTAAR